MRDDVVERLFVGGKVQHVLAAQFEIVGGRRPAIGEGNAVMVLEPGRLGATASRPDEGASIAVASADRASQMRGDMA